MAKEHQIQRAVRQGKRKQLFLPLQMLSMSNLFSVFVLVLLIVALPSCKDTTAPDFSSRIASASNQKEWNDVHQEVERWLAEHPTEMGAVWLGQLGDRAKDLSRTLDAERMYFKAAREYPDHPETPRHLYALATIYGIYLEQEAVASAICCYLKDKAPEALIPLAASCCREPALAPEDAILAIREQVFNPETGETAIAAARSFINICRVYALLYADQERSADHLNEAAKVAKSIKAFSQAVELYEWISTDYSHTPYGPKAMFLKAFTLENDLQNIEEARLAYEAYLNAWPDDDFADDARLLLHMLGKDPAEFLEQLQEVQ